MNCINTDYFKPFLQAFCEKTQPLYTCGYPWGPFVPYTMPRYNDADVKIFYMGRDTYYWVEQEELFEAFTNHVLEDYLGKNAACVDVEKMLGWKNNAGSFWTMVAKLHLLIRTGRYTEDIMQISAADKVILEEIGYGNINAIEQQTSLSKEGYWEAITSLDGYCQIREAGRPFEKLKSVIEAYHPDFIFIFNWEERDDVFEGMDFEWQKVYYKDKLQAVYTLPSYSTKVIWTSHPRRYSYLGTNIEEMAGSLADTFAAIR